MELVACRSARMTGVVLADDYVGRERY